MRIEADLTDAERRVLRIALPEWNLGTHRERQRAVREGDESWEQSCIEAADATYSLIAKLMEAGLDAPPEEGNAQYGWD